MAQHSAQRRGKHGKAKKDKPGYLPCQDQNQRGITSTTITEDSIVAALCRSILYPLRRHHDKATKPKVGIGFPSYPQYSRAYDAFPLTRSQLLNLTTLFTHCLFG
jgi:hypothetical protein